MGRAHAVWRPSDGPFNNAFSVSHLITRVALSISAIHLIPIGIDPTPVQKITFLFADIFVLNLLLLNLLRNQCAQFCLKYSKMKLEERFYRMDISYFITVTE